MTKLLVMAFVLMSELSIEPSKTDDFMAYVRQEIAATRGFEGNQQFDVLVDPKAPGKVIFYEQWLSREAFDRYWSWRVARGDNEKLQKFFAAPLVARSFEKAL